MHHDEDVDLRGVEVGSRRGESRGEQAARGDELVARDPQLRGVEVARFALPEHPEFSLRRARTRPARGTAR